MPITNERAAIERITAKRCKSLADSKSVMSELRNHFGFPAATDAHDPVAEAMTSALSKLKSLPTGISTATPAHLRGIDQATRFHYLTCAQHDEAVRVIRGVYGLGSKGATVEAKASPAAPAAATKKKPHAQRSARLPLPSKAKAAKPGTPPMKVLTIHRQEAARQKLFDEYKAMAPGKARLEFYAQHRSALYQAAKESA